MLPQPHTDPLPGRAVCLLGSPGPGNWQGQPACGCEPQGWKEHSWGWKAGSQDLRESASLGQGTTKFSSPKEMPSKCDLTCLSVILSWP